MASDNDFSAITQLMDVKRLYEEQEEKWRIRLTNNTRRIRSRGKPCNYRIHNRKGMDKNRE